MRGDWSADRWFLLPGVLAAFTVGLTYLTVFTFPGHYGGLFLDMAMSLSEHGRYVPRIDGYTAEGVPFAYPPIGLLLLAVGLRVGIDAAMLYWALPLGMYLLAVVPTYRIAVELTDSRSVGALATVFVLSSPEVFRPLIVATGATRGPAYLFSALGILVGIWLFRDGKSRWLLAGGVLFGLTGLSHPVYATFYVLSYLLLWGVCDRTARGLLTGAGVAAIGFAVMSPWLASVVANHGVEIFVRTSQVRGGIGVNPFQFVVSYFYDPSVPVVAVTQGLGIVGFVWLSFRRRFLLPIWFLWIGVLFGNSRFLYFLSSIAGAWFAVAVVAPAVATTAVDVWSDRELPERFRDRGEEVVTVLFVVTVAVYSVTAGAAYVATDTDIEKISSDDREAMEWLSENTPEDATVIVVGNGGEWLPWFADRTSLVTPMGSEWKGNPAFSRQVQLRSHLLTCEQTACVESVIESLSVTPDYVYVEASHPSVASALRGDSKYRTVYRKDGIVVFRIESTGETSDRSLERPTDGAVTEPVSRADDRLSTTGRSGRNRPATAV